MARGLLFDGGQLLFQIGNLAVLDFGGLRQIAAPLRLFEFNLRLFQLRLNHADGVDGGFFILPLGGERLGFVLEVGGFLVNELEPFLARGVLFLGQRRALDFQLQNLTVELVQFRRLGIQLHLDARRRLVHEVNRLVRQKPVGDVAMRQRRRRDQRGILDAHAVMDLVPLLEPAQNRDGRLNGRFLDHDRLETPLQRRVFLDVFAVFVQRRRAHAAQFAARELRFHDVRRVRCAFRRARADDGVQFVNEQNDFAFAGDDFLEERLEPVLEFAAVFRPGNHRAQIHRHQPLVLERFRHVAAHDAAGEAFGDGRLAHAGFADEHRIVLGAARQHLHHAADFLVAPDDRVNLPLLCQCGQVAAVFVERLEFVFGIFVGHALVAAQFGERLEHGVALQAVFGKNLFERRPGAVQQAEQQMFGADVIVLEFGGFGLRGVERLAQVGPGIGVAGALDLVAAGELGFEVGFEAGDGHADAFEQVGDEAFGLADEGEREMFAVDFLVGIFAGDALGLLQRLL